MGYMGYMGIYGDLIMIYPRPYSIYLRGTITPRPHDTAVSDVPGGS